ncbi:MAG: hypothetical protein IJU64_04705 [Bacilli bacterium]|nr:hypothetical protein [Bacilli bacterium]
MALLKSKLRVLAVGALMASALGLASCSDVSVELPKAEQDAKILNVTETITHNNLEDLYETIVPGDSSSAEKVLNEVLLRLAFNRSGYFFDQGDHQGLKTLMAKKATLSTEEFQKACINWVKDEKVVRFEIDGAEAAFVTKKVEDFYAHIMTAVKKAMWAHVTNSSYQERGLFVETKFAKEQYANLNIDQAAYEAIDKADRKTLVDGSHTFEDVATYFGDAYLDNYAKYLSLNVLPDIYRKTIVEDYLIDENYSSLGHSYARKVQYIALKESENDAMSTSKLVSAYAKRVLESTASDMNTAIHDVMAAPAEIVIDEAAGAAFRDFHFLDRLYNGTFASSGAEYYLARLIYQDAGLEVKVSNIGATPVTYYPATKLGDVYEQYFKAQNDNRWNHTSTTLDFTGDGAYTRETGLLIESRKAYAANEVTEGWYTSSELSSVVSAFKDRLFKIQVANEVDSLDPAATVKNDSLSYGCYRQGNYYIIPETRESGDAHPYLYYDKSSSSWVILRVDEAVKGSKLAYSSNYNPEVAGSVPSTYNDFAKAGRRNGKASQDEIVLTVAGLMASSETYTKAARQKTVENAKIEYHDQSVYDYFKTTFPDLFD